VRWLRTGVLTKGLAILVSPPSNHDGESVLDVALKRTHFQLKSSLEGLSTNQKIIQAWSDYGVGPLTGTRLEEGRAVAADLISPSVVSYEVAQRVYDHCGMGLFGVSENTLENGFDPQKADDDTSRLAGIFGMLPISPLGYEAIYKDEFVGTCPDLAHICRHDEKPCGIFGWGIASYRRSGAYLFVHLGGMINEHLIPDLRWFTKAATSLGEKLIVKKLQYQPVPGSQIGSLFYPSYNELLASQSAATQQTAPTQIEEHAA
jgi:hypothetical protein